MKTTEPKSHGIMFKAEMVRAILAGKKTQTRRPLKPQPSLSGWSKPTFGFHHPTKVDRHGEQYPGEPVFAFADDEEFIRCPHPIVTRLWVRETWGLFRPKNMQEQAHRGIPIPADCEMEVCKGDAELNRRDYVGRLKVVYRADGEIDGMYWRLSLHMPRWASRIELEVMQNRVERRNDISNADAIAESFEGRAAFLEYVKILHRDKGDENPWCWVYDLKLLKVAAPNAR